MTKKLAIIVASGKVELFQLWLGRSYSKLRSNSDIRVIFIPWGKSYKRLVTLAESNGMEILPLKQDGNASNESNQKKDADSGNESNRNKALEFLSKSPPLYVGFLDDDTFVCDSWLSSMLNAIDSQMNCDVLISTVRDSMTGKSYSGHVFSRGKPFVYVYRGIINNKLQPGPCANSAVVSWKAIERIYNLNGMKWHIWDSQFANEPETCLDLSVKLVLVGARATVVPKAFVDHKDPSIPQREDSQKTALSRLTRRYLLYYKYLNEQALQIALQTIEIEKSEWRKNGIFVYTSNIKVDDIEKFAREAKEHAQILMNKRKAHYQIWKDAMLNSGQAWSIFNLRKSG
ncbi:MAG: hypothetical protein MUP17_05325 [candidate division Zixibacteria bacterium]|nr:hypothetical protein [candidate division Zixibacteria bacterium]